TLNQSRIDLSGVRVMRTNSSNHRMILHEVSIKKWCTAIRTAQYDVSLGNDIGASDRTRYSVLAYLLGQPLCTSLISAYDINGGWIVHRHQCFDVCCSLHTGAKQRYPTRGRRHEMPNGQGRHSRSPKCSQSRAFQSGYRAKRLTFKKHIHALNYR